MFKLQPGYNDCTNAEYHGDINYLSSSSLKTMLKNPEQFYNEYVLGHKREFLTTATLEFGSYIHSLLLEPHKLDEEYAIYSGTKRGNEWEVFKKANEGKIILSNSQVMVGRDIQKIATSHPNFNELIGNGEAEKTLCTTIDNVNIKVRADYIIGDKIIDIKTTSFGTDLEAVQSTCLKWDYMLSAALYTDVFSMHENKKYDFYFIFIDKNSPISVEIYKASEEFLEYGRQKYKRAISLINESRRTGEWFQKRIQRLSLPGEIIAHMKSTN